MIYYNEIDPFCCEWLRRLIASGCLPEGYVDETPIQHVSIDSLAKYSSHHFFCGLGGWPHALYNLSGINPGVPLFTGSTPCQPYSQANPKAQGAKDDRNLWPVWFSIIQKLHPPVIFSEQVPRAIGHGWLDTTANDLESEDYTVAAAVLPATACNAWHVRERLWLAAYSNRNIQSWLEQYNRTPRRVGFNWKSFSWDRGWQAALSEFRTMDDGLPRRVEATDAVRNAVVPQVASLFVEEAVHAINLTEEYFF